MKTTAAKSEETVRKHQQMLLSVLENSAEGMGMTDETEKIIYLNRAARVMLGLGEDQDISSLAVDTFYTPEHWQQMIREIGPVLESTGQWSGIVYLRHFSSHEIIPCHSQITVIRDAQGRRIGMGITTRDIRKELAIQEQERKLLTLVDNSIDLMSILQLNGTNAYINKAGRKLLGIEEDADVTTIPISDFHTEEQLQFVESNIIPSVMSTGRWSGKFGIKNKLTGEIIPLENNCIRIDDAATGQPIAVGAVMRDLRPEIAASEQLLASQQRFGDLILASPVPFGVYLGREMVITFANKAILKAWDKDESVIGKTYREALPELEGQPFYGLLDQVYTTGKPYQAEEDRVDLMVNGKMQTFYFNFSFTPLMDKSGAVYGIVNTATDVTDLVVARHQLKEVQEQLKFAMEAGELGTWSLVPTSGAISWDDRTKQLHGINAGEGIDYIEVLQQIHPEDKIKVDQAVKRALDPASGGYYDVDFRIMGKEDNLLRWVRGKGKASFDKNNQPYLFAGTLQDITNQKELEKQKDNFLAIASHELKTPVTSIKAYAQLMEATFIREGNLGNAAMLGKMNVQLNRLIALIRDLLDVTKIQAGKLQFNDQVFDINEMINETIENLQFTTKSHRIEKKLGPSSWVYGDPDRIGQVLTNLMTNAIKYSPNAGTILVQSINDLDKVEVSVQDFGIGIGKTDQDKIFDQFYRVKEDSDNNFPGLGLGLHISSEIIKRANGKIWVESEPGKGSRFCFALKLYRR